MPVEHNIFDSSPTHELIEELSHKANFFVARKIFAAMPDKAFLRRQAVPNSRRLQSFVDRMNRLGFEMDPTSSGTLQASLFKIEDVDLRKVRKSLSTPPMKFLLIICIGYGNCLGQSNAARQVLCCR
jgi:protein SSD1